MVARALAIWVLGWVLVLMNTSIAVILPTYGVLFLLALPALRARSATLLVLVPVVVLGGASLVLWLRHELTGQTATDGRLALIPIWGELLTGYYPAILWLGYVLAGVPCARWALTDRDRQGRLAVLGAAVAVLGTAPGR